MLVAIAVLAGAVGEHDHRPDRRLREPRLPEDAQPAGAVEVPLPMAAAQIDSSAHGTTTASSWGASRATTYSAGSVSDTFSRMCVSRGGTYTRSRGSSISSCSRWSPHLTRSRPDSM